MNWGETILLFLKTSLKPVRSVLNTLKTAETDGNSVNVFERKKNIT